MSRRRLRGIFESIEQRRLFSAFVVNTTSDASSPGAGLLTLRQAIADANANPGADTIAFDQSVFAAGSVHTITLTQGELKLTDTSGLTTITGPGSGVLAINADQLSRVMEISTGVSAQISGLTLTGGSGGINSNGVAAYGGGLLNAGNASLQDVVITHNALIGLGTIQGDGIDNTGSLTLSLCTVSSNTGAGNGIDSTTSLSIVSSTITANAGAGIDCHDTLTIVGSTVSNNAGGIVCSNLVMTGCTVSGNAAAQLRGEQGGVVFKQIAAAGGGINATIAIIAGSTISDNSVSTVSDTPYGGPTYGGGLACQDATITGSTISGNTSTAAGYGKHTAIITNYNGFGGGIFATGKLRIIDSTVSGNTATGAQDTQFDTTDNPYSSGFGIGGGVAISPTGSLVVRRSTISGNSAVGGSAPSTGLGVQGSSYGGGIADGSSPYDPFGSDVGAGAMKIVESTIAGNAAHTAGGGIFSDGPFIMLDSTVSTNTSGLGSGIRAFGDPLVDNSIVAGNTGGKRDVAGPLNAQSSHNLLGFGGGIANGINGNITRVTNPLLGPLANNGGVTWTMLPANNSPALDAGDNALVPTSLTTDQRGDARVLNQTVDIGALEVLSA